MEAPAADLDNPIGDRVTQRMGSNVLGVADTAAGDVGADAGLGRELLQDTRDAAVGMHDELAIDTLQSIAEQAGAKDYPGVPRRDGQDGLIHSLSL